MQQYIRPGHKAFTVNLVLLHSSAKNRPAGAQQQGMHMAFGDSPYDRQLFAEWSKFCDHLKSAGMRVFKDANPATALQRVDGFRYLTQNLSQAFDLALETKDTKYPRLLAFCTPTRKLGSDNADCIYVQAWIDGESVYKISGKKGTARFWNLAVQGPRSASPRCTSQSTANPCAEAQGPTHRRMGASAP